MNEGNLIYIFNKINPKNVENGILCVHDGYKKVFFAFDKDI